jgi:hypothetical protein
VSKTTVTGEAKQVIGILAWAKAAGLQVSAVTVGACHVELRMAPVEQPEEREERPDRSIYAQFGGPALADAVKSGIPDSELQPAIGRSGR